jgi:RNA polymerase sigma factor (sigma-70 family)
MVNRSWDRFLGQVRQVAGRQAVLELSDLELLHRYFRERDENAFEALVWRHGPLVFGVSRRLTPTRHDAEDVFQATFLALVRKGRAIRASEALAAWLYRVAYRLALRVRARAAHGPVLSQTSMEEPAPVPVSDAERVEWESILHEEVNQLPSKYRAPLVLCYLEGRSTRQAADHLGCPRGTVLSRLAWARDRLRHRLSERGYALETGTLVLALFAVSESSLSAASVHAVIRASRMSSTAGTIGALGAAKLTTVVEGALSMALSPRKWITFLSLLALTIGGIAWFTPAFAQKGAPQAVPQLIAIDPPTLHLPAPLVVQWGIQTSEAKPRPGITREWTFPGSTAIDPNRLFRVRSSINNPSRVVEISKRPEAANDPPAAKPVLRELRPGDRVTKGEVLAVLESNEVGNQKQNLAEALMQLQLDQEILDRAEKVGDLPEVFLLNARRNVEADKNAVARARRELKTWNIPDEDLQAVEKEAEKISRRKGKRDAAAEAKWSRVKLVANADGIIVERNLVVDEQLRDDKQNLFQIADPDRLLVLAQAPAAELPSLRAWKVRDHQWSVRTDDPDKVTSVSTIDEIGEVVDPDQQTIVLKGHMENADGRFRAGQLVAITLTLTAEPSVVVIPKSALVEENGQTFVFVQRDAKRPDYVLRRVQVVRRGDDVVHVRSRLTPEEEKTGVRPLKPTEQVVTAKAVELKAMLEDLWKQDRRE